MKFKTLISLATKRSGHHSVLHSLCLQSKKNITHENNVLVTHFIRGKVKYSRGYQDGEIYGNGQDIKLWSFEDAKSFRYEEIAKNAKIDKNHHVIIVIRDIYNIISSTLRHNGGRRIKTHLDKRVDIWYQHCAEHLGRRNDIPDDKKTIILFNKWFEDKDYRKSICDRLGIEFTDEGINRVARYGGGSSYDFQNKDGKGQDMNVLNRYEHHLKEPAFFFHLSDKIHKMNKEVFGWDLSHIPFPKNEIIIKSTKDTFNEIEESMDKGIKTCYFKLGDQEIMGLSGRDRRGNPIKNRALGHNKSIWDQDMVDKVKAATVIQEEGFFVSTVGLHPLEPGMRKGVFFPQPDSFIPETLVQISNRTEYYNALYFHYYFLFQPKRLDEFLEKHIRPKKVMFVGAVNNMDKLLGGISVHVKTPARNSCTERDRIMKEIFDNLDGIEVVILCAGQMSRYATAALWKDPRKFHILDLGSMADVFDEKINRRWHMITKTPKIWKKYI